MRPSNLTSRNMGLQTKEPASGGRGGVSGRGRFCAFRDKLFPGMLLALLVSALTVYSCAPETKVQDQNRQPGAQGTPAAGSKLSGQDEWQRLLSAARSEGKVNVYGEAASMRGPFGDAFLNKYGIQIEVTVARPTETAEKLQRERRAGIYLADAVVGGQDALVGIVKPLGVLDSLEPTFMLTELTSAAELQKTWWRGKLYWNDDAHTSLSFAANPSIPMAVNTDIVKPPITSYKNLLDPRWKGKIIFQDPTAGGGGFRRFAAAGAIFVSWDFWREVMAKQEPAFTRDARLQMEGVARGKYAIAFSPNTEQITYFRDGGAPVDFALPVEGSYIGAGIGGIAVVTQPAHPNAAKLLVNFLLSQEGQTLFSKASGLQSTRMDVPTDHLHPAKMRQPGINYYVPEGDKSYELEMQWKKIVDEMVIPYVK